jgi:hypothetical protein
MVWLLEALPIGSASATTTDVLTSGAAGGTNVSVGDVLSAGLKSGSRANFSDSGGQPVWWCNASTLSGEVLTNPQAPGTASLSLSGWANSLCTGPGPTTVQGISFDNLPYNLSTSTFGGATISPGGTGPIQTTFTIVFFGITSDCVYRAHDSSGNLSGTTSNVDNSIGFTNQLLDLFNGPSVCAGQLTFSAAYGPLVDSSQSGSPQVFVN